MTNSPQSIGQSEGAREDCRCVQSPLPSKHNTLSDNHPSYPNIAPSMMILHGATIVTASSYSSSSLVPENPENHARQSRSKLARVPYLVARSTHSTQIVTHSREIVLELTAPGVPPYQWLRDSPPRLAARWILTNPTDSRETGRIHQHWPRAYLIKDCSFSLPTPDKPYDTST